MLVLHVSLSCWVVLLPLILLAEVLFAVAAGMLLSAANVRAGYATADVLQGVSVEVGQGEVVGVLRAARDEIGHLRWTVKENHNK